MEDSSAFNSERQAFEGARFISLFVLEVKEITDGPAPRDTVLISL